MLLFLAAWASPGVLVGAEPVPTFEVFTNLYTGGGLTLASGVQPIAADTLRTGRELGFAFGFGTNEDPVEGQFLDSATITLQDADKTSTFILLTADASGVAWAPPGGGMDVSLLRYTPISPGSWGTPWRFATAYWVRVPVPSQLDGKAASLFLDLFDNGDFVDSATWMSLLEIPEPSSGLLLSLGLLLHWFWRRVRH